MATDYMLYGVSYGTVLATVTAARAEAEGITPPRALVLEGTVGQVFEVVRTEAYCTSDPVDHPYFARDWLVNMPIYYFNGTNDPNTPMWQAQAHYDAQTQAPRRLVAIAGGGHNPFIFNLNDCKADVWAAMATGAGFGDAIGRCAWPTQVAVATAQPRRAALAHGERPTLPGRSSCPGRRGPGLVHQPRDMCFRPRHGLHLPGRCMTGIEEGG